MSVLCAIHQPNFFPWLGYFDKIRRADTFLFLDAVDYPRSGSGGMGSWTNRVKLTVGGEQRWVGCPVQRTTRGTPIAEVAVDDRQPWRGKLIKTLQANYAKAPNFADTMALVTPLIENPQSGLATFNIVAVTAIAAHLGISARFVRQSSLTCRGHGTAMLIDLVQELGADAYLAGGGAAGYQEDALFEAAGVALQYQEFTPRPYGEAATFTPGLSVIDYLMHDGRTLEEAFPDAG